MAVIPSPGLILPISDRVDLVQGNPALSPTGIARIAMIGGVPSVSINGGAYASFGAAGSAPSGTVQPQVRYLPTDHLDFIMGDPPVSPKGCGRLAVTTAGVASVSIESAAYASLGVSGAASTGCQIFPGFLYSTDYVDIVQGNPAVSLPGTARIACFTGATTLSISINGAAYTTLGALSPPGTPVLWFDAQNIDGTNNSSLIDGQALGTWLNLSSLGTAGNAVQATGGLRPTFKLVGSAGKLNNKSTVNFVLTQWMQTANVATWNQPNTIWVVAKNQAGGTHTFIDGNDAVNRNDLLATATWEEFAGVGLYDSAIAATVNVYHVIRATFNGASSTMRVNKASSIAGASPGTAALDGLSIGVGGDATSPMIGEIAEIVVYNSSTADTFLDSYFDAKYGSSWPQ